MTHRPRVLRPLVGSLAVLLAAATLAACGSTARGAARTPLASGEVSGSTAWAVIAMGDLSVPDNTFFELLVRDGGRWSLVTPSDIATNGGIVAAPTDDDSLAGVVPSNELRFSPLAATSDAGRTWATGVLPAGLVPAPDALARLGSGRVLALLATRGGTLVEGGGDLSGWATVARRAGIAADLAKSGCRLTALTAVAATPDGSPVVGGTCHARSTGPVAMLVGGRWRAIGPVLGLDHTERVLRLASGPSGTDVLLATTLGQGPILGAARRDPAGRWVASAPLATLGAALVSSTFGANGVVLVVVRSPDGVVAHETDLGGATEPWRTLPVLPSGTQVVVPIAGGTEALAVDGSHLRVLELSDGRWRAVQRMDVPIAYGSSS